MHANTLPAPRSVCRSGHPGISFWSCTVLYWKLALCLPLSCEEPSGLFPPDFSFCFLCPPLGIAPSFSGGTELGSLCRGRVRPRGARGPPWEASAGWTPARPGLRVGLGAVSPAADNMPRVPCPMLQGVDPRGTQQAGVEVRTQSLSICLWAQTSLLNCTASRQQGDSHSYIIGVLQ